MYFIEQLIEKEQKLLHWGAAQQLYVKSLVGLES